MIGIRWTVLVCALATGCGDNGSTTDLASSLDMAMAHPADQAVATGPDSGMCAGTAASCGMPGACAKCPTPLNAVAACNANICGYTCANGTIDCTGCVDTKVDVKNCGHCGRNCLGGPCSDGACMASLLGETLNNISVAADTYNVYFTDSGSGNVYRLSLMGQGGPMVVAANQNGPAGLALDTANVYWTTLGGGTVMKQALMNGMPVSVAAGQAQPSDLAIDASYVYWVNQGDGTVMRAPIAGGNPSPIASGQKVPTRIAADGKNVYWTNAGDGTVMQVQSAGGVKPTQLAAGQAAPNGIAVDAKFVYWVDGGDGTVRRVAIGGGAQPTTLATKQSTPYSIAVDASGVYWTNYADGMIGTVEWLAPNANAPVAIATPPNSQAPSGIALDLVSVFYVDKLTGNVWRYAK